MSKKRGRYEMRDLEPISLKWPKFHFPEMSKRNSFVSKWGSLSNLMIPVIACTTFSVTVVLLFFSKDS